MRNEEANRLSALVRRPGRAGPRRGIVQDKAGEEDGEILRPPERDQPSLF
jgi:hypothetical protein